MEDLRKEQEEALGVLYEYNQKLVKAIHTVILELREGRKEDTEEFLNTIINGLNWEIEVFNGTMSLINEKENVIDKTEVNTKVIVLGDALKAKDDARIADAFENGILPVLGEFEAVSKVYA